MQTIKVNEIRKCPLCGSKAIMRKNASKDFQVKCSKCEFQTGWRTKPEAIAVWYNLMIAYWTNNGYLSLPDTPKKG